MPLRSRVFCLSLRSRRLDFIPGGIYQGALNSFIHSFPYPSPRTHRHTHSSMPGMPMFLLYIFIKSHVGAVCSLVFFPLKHILELDCFSPSVEACVGPRPCSHKCPMLVDFFQPPLLFHLVWCSQSNVSASTFF